MRPLYRRQRAYFNRAYVAEEHGWPKEGTTPHVVKLLKRLGPGRGRTALDLGCGEGRHSILLAGKGYTVTGLDYEPLALKAARAAARRARTRARFVQGDALALRFPKESFDLVLDYGCFHHVLKRDWPLYRKNLVRILRPGGHLLISVFSTKFRHFPGERRTRPWLVHRGHYDHFFTSRTLRDALHRSFDIVGLIEEHEGLNGFLHGLMRVKHA